MIIGIHAPSSNPSRPAASVPLRDRDGAEANVDVAALRLVPFAEGGPAVAAVVVEGAAADHPGQAGGRPEWVTPGADLVIVVVEPVGAPLRDVAVHVVDAQGVRRAVLAHAVGA